jgi:uncharacterized protein YidB (DUF937 family)
MNLLNKLFSEVGLDKPINIPTLLTWLEGHGGPQGVIDKFKQHDLVHLLSDASEQTSNSIPALTESHIEKVFGTDSILILAKQLGVDPQQASNLLSTYLPKLLPLLTNENQPTGIASRAMNIIKSMFQRER